MTRYFSVRGIGTADAAADEVLDRLARKLLDGATIDVIGTYALGVARMLVLELRRVPELLSVSDKAEVLPAAVDHMAGEEKETRLNCLDICLTELSDANRELITEYYSSDKREKVDSRQSLADRLRVSSNALRNRAVRIRRKLEDCVKACLND